MPAKSKAQQRLMGMAYAVKKGEMSREEASKEVLNLADNLTLKQLKDYAETDIKNLPDKVGVNEYSLGSHFTGSYMWFTQAAQSAVQKIAMSQDKNDPVINQFIDYLNKDDEDDEHQDNLDEGDYGTALSASPSNVPGMGNVSPPSTGVMGSGDNFSGFEEDEEDEEEKKNEDKLMDYKKYQKWLNNKKK